MSADPQESLRKLPKVDRLLAAPRAQALLGEYSRSRVVEALRVQLDGLRIRLREGTHTDFSFSEDAFFDEVALALAQQHRPSLRRVINATGIVLHTNLGRAPLADAAIAAVDDVARGYSNLEFDLVGGKRGSRYAHVERLLCDLTGAEAAIVVNNNAAAVMLAVNTHARDAEVVTSRGELIEIGGSFRIPDVIERSEANLVEVGTTNKTRIDDYAKAISNATRILLKVHPSNYKIVGFTSSAQREEMIALASERGLIMMEDLGSGTLVDLTRYGLAHETTVQDAVAAGAGVVTFSGDKLLGGPQAGIAVGRAEYIDAMKKNTLARALRPDKMTLAALEATLRLYLDEDRLAAAVPVHRMLAQSDEELEAKANVLCEGLRKIDGLEAQVERGQSYSGGGSLPDEAIPTRLVTVASERLSPDALAAGLRESSPPVIARIADGALVLDVRTIDNGESDRIVDAVRRLHS